MIARASEVKGWTHVELVYDREGGVDTFGRYVRGWWRYTLPR